MELDYVKGHMGGNTILLLLGEQMPLGREIEVTQKLLTPNYMACHEAGLLYGPQEGGHLKVRIVEMGYLDYISACGGMTQVLGKSLVETWLGRFFHIPVQEPLTEVLLETDGGITRIQAVVTKGAAGKIVTDMTPFARECYEMGVYPMMIQGVEVMRVGKYLVVEGEAFHEIYPDLDYAALDSGSRKRLASIQGEFQRMTGLTSHDYALYDKKPRFQGDLRAVFPHDIEGGRIEPACGTGSVAIAIALCRQGKGPSVQEPREGEIKVRLETGGGENLTGRDMSELKLSYRDGRITRGTFAHSFIQITSTGKIRL